MSPAKSEQKSLPTLAVELKDLVVAYAKQETIEPIKGLGRFIAFGMAGSLLLSVGLVLLVLGLLRALQTETGDVFDGNFTWAPYLITLVVESTSPRISRSLPSMSLRLIGWEPASDTVIGLASFLGRPADRARCG